MKTLRITVSSVDIAKHNEPEFQKMLTEKFIANGFNIEYPIIRQERSDVAAVDFIQFKYNWLDRFDVQLEMIIWKIYKWFKVNF